jgi:hypothetical protein
MPLPFDMNRTPVSVQEQDVDPLHIYIDHDRFLDIMQSLHYAASRLTMVEGYCSNDENAQAVKERREELLRCLDLVLNEEVVQFGLRAEDAGKRGYVRRDRGLSKAHQKAYEHVMKVASIELVIGRVPALPN